MASEGQAFFDVVCTCGRRIGWCGAYADRPACPHCGKRPTQADLDAAEARLDAARARALAGDETGTRWREKRLAIPMTLVDAARRLDLTGIELSRIERGEVEPDAALAAKMEVLYGHDVADVVTD